MCAHERSTTARSSTVASSCCTLVHLCTHTVGTTGSTGSTSTTVLLKILPFFNVQPLLFFTTQRYHFFSSLTPPLPHSPTPTSSQDQLVRISIGWKFGMVYRSHQFHKNVPTVTVRVSIDPPTVDVFISGLICRLQITVKDYHAHDETKKYHGKN